MTLTKIGASLGGSADIINVVQTSHTFVSNDRGKAVRMNNNSGTPQYVLAIASATTTADAIGIIIHVTDGNNFTMATSGRITVDYCVPNEVAGTVLFLSHATAGVLTSTEPSAAGHVSKPMAVITIANSEMIMLQQRGEVITTGAVSIADGSVDNDAMADNAIDTDEIAADAVTNAKLANMAANTVKVNATTSSDNPTDISMASATLSGAIADGDVLLIYDASTTSVKTVAKSVLVAGLGGIASVLADTTPQLGGNLDMQARLLVGNGGSTGIAISAAGEVTMASQPSVAAYNSVSDNNVTGGAQEVTIDFDTEIFDQNADFASDTFTAPVTGRYLVTATVRTDGSTSASDYAGMKFKASNREWEHWHQPAGDSNVGSMAHHWAAIIDMDAADTVYILFKTQGDAQVVDIMGSTNPWTYFTAQLIA